MVKKHIFLTGLGLIFIIFDQLLKFLFLKYFSSFGGSAVGGKGGFFIIEKFFGFDFYQNYGMAFGLKLPPFLFYLLVVLIIYFIFEKFKKEIKEKNFFILLALTFVLAGGASNLFDRLSRGYVIDYLYLYPMSYFNLADIAILAGVIMLARQKLYHRK